MDLKNLTSEDIEQLRSVLLASSPAQVPPVPETPPLTLKDVLLLLVRHTRLPDEATMNRCYAAIEDAFPDAVVVEEKSDDVD